VDLSRAVAVEVAVRASRDRGPGPAGLGHLSGLDGLRGVAVLAVMLYHGGVSWMQGGFFGVDLFFVLSGFLITSLLLEEQRRAGSIGLGGFWSRRIRRLLPALLLLIAGVAVYAWLVSTPEARPGVRNDVFATLGYVANWHFIAEQTNYFAQAASPSPLAHTWSLAIEEQFYLVWPLLVLLLGRGRGRLVRVGLLALAGWAASATAMALLFHPGANPSREYYGTDTRSQVLMAGALTAVLVAAFRRRAEEGHGLPGRRSFTAAALAGAAVLGAGGVGAGFVLGRGSSPWVYRGGMSAVAAAAALVVAATALAPRSLLPRVLSFPPLRAVGLVSYGLYLYHWPLYLVIDHSRTGLSGYPLLAVRMAATGTAAVVSYHLVEMPVRRGALRRIWATVSLPAALAAAVAATLAATSVPAVAAAPPPSASTTPTTSPAGLVNRRPPPAPGQPVKVMFIGDSVAETLGVGMVEDAARYGISIDDRGTLGCGIVTASPYEYFGNTSDVLPQCYGWQQQWRQILDSDAPDVVFLVVGRWEVMDRFYDGHWTHLGDPAFDAYVTQQLDQAVRILSSTGAVVAVATAPYYLRGETPSGGRYPEDDPARVDQFNQIVRGVVSRYPHSATVVDLNAKTSIGGVYTPYIDGIEMRYDGVHFTPVADRWLAPWLLPQLEALGPDQASVTPTTTTTEAGGTG
jgi:peptidoglycan/LPS O-acetylase OafA/YrhL/lysophospholipase L1-like esterase